MFRCKDWGKRCRQMKCTVGQTGRYRRKKGTEKQGEQERRRETERELKPFVTDPPPKTSYKKPHWL